MQQLLDWMVPTAVTSAEILKSNPSQIRVLMSEKIVQMLTPQQLILISLLVEW